MLRTVRSASRSTPSIISFSAGAKTPACVPSEIIERTSSSVTVSSRAPCRPSRRSSRSVEAPSSQTKGAAMRDSMRIGGAIREATRSGFFRAMRLGISSPSTMDR